MRHDEKTVNSIAELINKLDAHRIGGELLWFRGQADVAWNLEPSVARDRPDPVDYEWATLKRFRQNAVRFLNDTQLSDWGWLFLMQHYGVPTRLLDWSESPLVGLYFAVSEEKHSARDAALWVLAPTEFNTQAGFRSKINNDLPCCEMDPELDNYLTRNVSSSGSAQNPVAAIASRNSSRIAAQLGVFTVFHSDFTPIESLFDTKHVWRYRIPAGSKPQLRKELDALQITRLSLFPELANAGEFAKGILG